MKRKQLLGGVLLVFMLAASCKKTTESVVDCLGESIKLSLHVTVNASNAKQISSEVKYWGSKTISSVKWEYGDGSTQTTTGLTNSHTYTTAGTYTVKANVTLTEGKSSCGSDHTKSVTIL